jgi:hypothetical protein
MPILTGTGDAAIVEVSEDIATVEAAVVQLDTDLTAAEGDIDDLEAVLVPTVSETQLRAPAGGDVTIATSGGNPLAVFDTTADRVSFRPDGTVTEQLVLNTVRSVFAARPLAVRSTTTFETSGAVAYATFDDATSSVSTTGNVTVGGTLSLGATNVNTTLSGHGGRLEALETVLVANTSETQIRAPTGGKVTIERSSDEAVDPEVPFATFDTTDSSVALTGALTVAGKDLKADIETLEARVSGTGNDNYRTHNSSSAPTFSSPTRAAATRTCWATQAPRPSPSRTAAA